MKKTSKSKKKTDRRWENSNRRMLKSQEGITILFKRSGMLTKKLMEQ